MNQRYGIGFISKSKLLLLCVSIFMVQNVYATSTVCYKKNWTKPSKIESIALDGGKCGGNHSLNQMKKKGWFIKDIKITTSSKGLNYTYVLTDSNPVAIKKEQIIRNMKSEKINLKQTFLEVRNVTDNTAIIDQGNLKVGQSGIIEHSYANGNKIIVSSAYVISSNSTSSTIKFIPFLDLKQNAIPTSNRKVTNGDKFLLNYLYNFSLLITPDGESFKLIRRKFRENSFLHSDVFAAYLKFIFRPLPTKEIIQDFALSQNMGTIFVVLESNLYVLDSRTFTLLDKRPLKYVSKEMQMPFYTRVEDIESSMLTRDYTKWLNLAKKYLGADNRTEEEILYEDEIIKKSKDSKLDYTQYYKKLLGV